MRFDLHVHTRASDGVLTPAELLRLAAKVGLHGVAITDHDSVDGVAEAVAEGDRLGLEVIPGIELSLQIADEDVHLLGYWIDHRSSELHAALREIFQMRAKRVEGMVVRLGELG